MAKCPKCNKVVSRREVRVEHGNALNTFLMEDWSVNCANCGAQRLSPTLKSFLIEVLGWIIIVVLVFLTVDNPWMELNLKIKSFIFLSGISLCYIWHIVWWHYFAILRNRE